MMIVQRLRRCVKERLCCSANYRMRDALKSAAEAGLSADQLPELPGKHDSNLWYSAGPLKWTAHLKWTSRPVFGTLLLRLKENST